MVKNLFNSTSGSVTKQLRFLSGVLCLVTLTGGIALGHKISDTANRKRVAQAAQRAQSSSQRLLNFTLADVAPTPRPASEQASTEPTAPSSPQATKQEIDRLINGLVNGSSDLAITAPTNAALATELAELAKAWDKLQIAIDSYSNTTQPNEEALLSASESFWALSEQAIVTAAGEAQSQTQQTTYLFWILFILDLALLAALFSCSQRLHQTLKGTISTITTASNELSMAVAQQESAVLQQSTSVTQVASTIHQLETTSRQTTEKANAAMVVTTSSLERTQRAIQLVKETLAEMLHLEERIEAVTESIEHLSLQSREITGISALFSDFAHRVGMFALSPAVEAIQQADYNQSGGQEGLMVGQEIQALSAQSQTIAKEVRQLVNDLQTTLNNTMLVTETDVDTIKTGIQNAKNILSEVEQMEASEDTVVANIQQVLLMLEQQFDALNQGVEALAGVDQSSKGIASGFTQAQVETERLKQTSLTLKQMT